MSRTGPPAAKRRRKNIEIARSEQQQTKNLMDLNDECLLKIFRYLKRSGDLGKVEKVCKRFAEFAEYAFVLDNGGARMGYSGNYGYEHTEKMLRIIGRHISSLSIWDFHYGRKTWNKILLLVQEYCAKLKKLQIKGFIDRSLFSQLKPLFKRLEKLSLHCGSLRSSDLDIMNNLKALNVSAGVDMLLRGFSPIKLTKMQEMSFHDASKIDDASMIHIIKLTTNLKKLSISGANNLTTAVFDAIGQLKELEELEFLNPYMKTSENFQDDLMHLTSLCKLKILKFNCAKQTLYPLLEGLSTNGFALIELELHNGSPNDRVFESICKIKTLKKLNLFYMNGLKDEHILEIAKELKLLSDIFIRISPSLSQLGLRSLKPNSKCQLTISTW
ncbi:uncharacterized protein LOC116340636 [Contarinia nasturtii]|uniref:uncharacterized protein LOC116340636 n=1 Tax=Contarinia nasturtii TaxID=265458 RepID=UPI0012D3E99F|nr:uncharacterized protein LOC116340636 [Contarinia nasturtii]